MNLANSRRNVSQGSLPEDLKACGKSCLACLWRLMTAGASEDNPHRFFLVTPHWLLQAPKQHGMLPNSGKNVLVSQKVYGSSEQSLHMISRLEEKSCVCHVRTSRGHSDVVKEECARRDARETK
ncbi:hypothetical protein BaRGS_00022536 [Batillaria attramentaria]|uniref:Uncharacterized protein n=1 Tax=Batillaria attramentaria TaxID=370345 RepID=A0ABD0KGQ6_9CAEN